MIKIRYKYVKKPRWSNKDGSTIDCLVKFDHLKIEVPFTASIYDYEIHGREIWHKCVSGEFGKIDVYIQPKETQNNSVDIKLPQYFDELNLFLIQVNAENSRKSFRSVVILWGIMLDKSFDELLRGYNDKKYSNFSKKVKRAFDLNLINNTSKLRCDCIRKIRNKAAHKTYLTLKDVELKSYLKTLYNLDHSKLFYFIEDIDFLLQMIFTGSCSMMVMSLKKSPE